MNDMQDLKSQSLIAMLRYLRRVASLETFVRCRERILATLDEIELNGRCNRMELEYPWINDLFIYGLLDSEDALNEAKAELWNALSGGDGEYLDVQEEWKGCYAGLSGGVVQDKDGLSTEIIQGMEFPHEKTCEEALNQAWYWLRYLGESGKDAKREILKAIQSVAVKPVEKDKLGKMSRWFVGRHEFLPCPLTNEWKYRTLGANIMVADVHDSECQRFRQNYDLLLKTEMSLQMVLGRKLQKCDAQAGDDKADIQNWRYQQTVETLRSPSNSQNVMRLGMISLPLRERIANGCLARDVLYARLYDIAERLNCHGSGAIPAWHLENRQERDGGWISEIAHDCNSLQEAIDRIVSDTYAGISGFETVDGVPVTTYEVFRDYQDGELSTKYLTALLENALDNRKHKVLHPKGGEKVIKVEVDKPVRDADGNGKNPVDDLPDAHARQYDDSSAFILKVIEKYAPHWWKYYCLTEIGIQKEDIDEFTQSDLSLVVSRYQEGDQVKKGDALKLVGAKTAHFVDHERNALISKLKERKSLDFKEIVERLKHATGKKK